jgi:hypothetical protein
MATQAQYDVFVYVYEEENKRYESLQDRAKLYLSIASIYLGAIAFKADDVLKVVAQFHIPMWLWLATGGILVVAVVLITSAVRIRTYEGICDLEELIANFGPEPPADEDFFDDRLVDLAVATNRNSASNDRAARLLGWAAAAMILAFSLQLTFFIFAVYTPLTNVPPQRPVATGRIGK